MGGVVAGSRDDRLGEERGSKGGMGGVIMGSGEDKLGEEGEREQRAGRGAEGMGIMRKGCGRELMGQMVLSVGS